MEWATIWKTIQDIMGAQGAQGTQGTDGGGGTPPFVPPQEGGGKEGLPGVIQQLAPILSMFRKSPQGRQKELATADQVGFERAAQQIQQDVFSGRMDVDSGLDALDDLAFSLNRSGGNQFQAAGASNAGRLIAQIRALVSTLRNQQLHSYDENITGSPRFQADRLRTRLRARLEGQPLGETIRNTEMERLFTPAPRAMDNVDEVRGRVEEMFPNTGAEAASARISARLAELGKRPGLLSESDELRRRQLQSGSPMPPVSPTRRY